MAEPYDVLASLNRMLEKNEIVWSHKLFNGGQIILKEGLIRFSETFFEASTNNSLVKFGLKIFMSSQNIFLVY